MDYQIKSIKKISAGFTLVEILIVISITAILAMVSTSVYTNLNARENLEISTNSLIEAIRYAQSNSRVGKGDSEWGIRILQSSFVIFKGSNYVSRNVSFDQSFNFSKGVVVDGLSEIVFEKITGWTEDDGAIILTNSYGTKDILINEKGTLTY